MFQVFDMRRAAQNSVSRSAPHLGHFASLHHIRDLFRRRGIPAISRHLGRNLRPSIYLDCRVFYTHRTILCSLPSSQKSILPPVRSKGLQ